LAARGAWGSIFRVDLNSDREGGLISIFVLGDARHSSFDNLTFADANTLLAAEDRGDTLHSQLNRLDSIWSFFVDGSPATRFVALGRDKLAEIDASLLGTPGYQNEGDNEPTGLHVSTGSTLASGIPGTRQSRSPSRFLYSATRYEHSVRSSKEKVGPNTSNDGPLPTGGRAICLRREMRATGILSRSQCARIASRSARTERTTEAIKAVSNERRRKE